MFRIIKSVVSCTIVSLLMTQYAFLAVAKFQIDISPDKLTPGQAADIAVKAIDEAGNVVTDYQDTIIIQLQGAQDESIYTIPNNGFYNFLPEDLGQKVFSKGLTIKKSGKFVVEVYDAISADIIGSAALIVGDDTKTISTTQNIKIIEPLNGSTMDASAVYVIGTVSNKLTPLEFYIDNKKVPLTGESDATGNFSVYLPMVSAGIHVLQVKMKDASGIVIDQSEEISFTYTPPQTDSFLKILSVTPNGDVDLGTSIVVTAKTDTTVRSIELSLGTDGTTFVMDRQSVGVFTKSIMMDKSGLYRIDATLIFEGGQRTPYTDRAIINVIPKNIVDISALKVVNNPADPSKVSLSWGMIGTPSSYIVRYGAAQDALKSAIKTSQTNVEVAALEIGKQYYFQVFAVDESGTVVGTGSDIASILTAGQSAPGVANNTCQVVGIDLTTKKIGDKYFLVRDTIENAVEYHIYKSEYQVASIETMQKVGTTSIAQFEYPFDPNVSEDQYTYYAVIATCTDGSNLQIDGVKKVHTGPFSDMLMLLFVSLLFYSLYRVYRFSS